MERRHAVLQSVCACARNQQTTRNSHEALFDRRHRHLACLGRGRCPHASVRIDPSSKAGFPAAVRRSPCSSDGTGYQSGLLSCPANEENITLKLTLIRSSSRVPLRTLTTTWWSPSRQ